MTTWIKIKWRCHDDLAVSVNDACGICCLWSHLKVSCSQSNFIACFVSLIFNLFYSCFVELIVLLFVYLMSFWLDVFEFVWLETNIRLFLYWCPIQDKFRKGICKFVCHLMCRTVLQKNWIYVTVHVLYVFTAIY